jgi:hypothetical protein
MAWFMVTPVRKTGSRGLLSDIPHDGLSRRASNIPASQHSNHELCRYTVATVSFGFKPARVGFNGRGLDNYCLNSVNLGLVDGWCFDEYKPAPSPSLSPS